MLSPLCDRVILARNYTRASRTSSQIRLIPIHTMEAPEAATTAESVAAWFAGSGAPQASAHYCVDSDSIVGCVHEDDVAWAAPGCNHDGIQIESAGRAGQTKAQWDDAYSKAELVKAARLVADICKRHGIPARRLTNAELKAGKRGIIGHHQASEVYGGTHWDPGPNFPWREFVADVKALTKPRRFMVVLQDKDGKVVARSKVTGAAGLAPRWTAFTARVASRVQRMNAEGRGPRVRVVRV